MKKNIRINPSGLKGKQIKERMIELMGIKQIKESNTKSVIELTKIGPDGNAYAIVRENHEYYIKLTRKTEGIIAEDFNYIGGLKNKKSEAYPSYAKAIKHMNLKFKSLAEAYGKGGDINVFENDNIVSEDIAGFSSSMGNGFSNEGNLEGNEPSSIKEEDEDEDEVELTEEEEAIDAMLENDIDEMNSHSMKTYNMDLEAGGKPVTADEKEDEKEKVNEHKLSILKAIKNMDAIIDTLSENTVKKKTYTLK